MTAAPELLHSSQGLTVVRNPKNGFVIVDLDYTADPDKRSAAWEAEARAGMSPAKFLREYKRDFGAAFGEKVFPGMIARKHEIVLHAPYPTFGGGAQWYGGFDFGQRNPASFHVYVIDDGVVYVVWELYEPCVNIKDYAAKLRQCPHFSKLRYIAADPHIADLRHFDSQGNGASILDQFRVEGVKKFFLAPNSESSWLSIMRSMWPAEGDIKLKVFDSCPFFIQEFQEATFAGVKNEAIYLRTPKESIADFNNHAQDDCKYFFLSLNSSARDEIRGGVELVQERRKRKWPTMVDAWKN